VNDQLNLQEYGLDHLKGKNLLFVDESDITKLLDAVSKEDMSIYLPIRQSRESFMQLLAQSNCRRCSKCCLPNPFNPKHPGIDILERELEPIAKHLHVSLKKLKRKTAKGKPITSLVQPTESEMTRWLPLPCPFLDVKSKQCRIYPVRPFVCRIYPVLGSENRLLTEVKVNCDYGKDIVRHAIKTLREQRPGLKWLL